MYITLYCCNAFTRYIQLEIEANIKISLKLYFKNNFTLEN